ncbi:MAG: family 16 glycoside hydrolase [bacterium]
MVYKSILSFIATILLVSQTNAQNVKPRLDTLSLNTLDAFRTPASNWKIIGAAEAGYNDTIFNTAKGAGILYNDFDRFAKYDLNTNLMTKMEHGDMLLSLDIMIPKGSNSGIYLQSRYEVQILDSWGVKMPKYGDLGGIYQGMSNGKGFQGMPPLTNAALAPGLWQHMEISFQAPRFDASGKKISSAKFNYVKLNGITLHENIIVSNPTGSAAFDNESTYGPLMIQGDHGRVAFKNIRYATQDELKVTTSDIGYKYYEKSAKNPEDAAKIKPTSQGPAAAIDSRLASAADQYFIQFEGKMKIPVKDTYTFNMLQSGDASLEIDGKVVIPKGWTWTGAGALTGTTELTAGEHNFKLWVNKDVSWDRSGLALFIEKPNSRSVALHSPASMPERNPAPLIMVKADRNVEMIRSFMDHGEKKGDNKLTHVVSVGDPSRVNYAYNLTQGALLQVWKGDFLNTTDMWHERGEPQTATPAGAPIVLSGSCPVYDNTLSIDTVADYQYKGYTLSSTGKPTFNYEYRKYKVQDELTPTEKGIKRTLYIKSDDNKDALKIRVAQAQSITPLGDGLYVIGQQSYYVELPKGVQPSIETYQGQKILFVPVKDKLEYQLIW